MSTETDTKVSISTKEIYENKLQNIIPIFS